MSFFFDASTVAPSSGERDLLPAGDYRLAVTNATLKPTRNNDGKRIEVESTVLDGEHKSRKIWTNFNVQNPSADAQRIGQEQLSALCHATGRIKLSDPTELIGGTYIGKVTIRAGKNGYKDSNEIVKWSPATGAIAAPAARPTAGAVPAWAKKAS